MQDIRKIVKSDIEIEIRDLLWELVRRWRLIIVMAILGAVLFVTYQYQSDAKKTNVVTIEKTRAELETQLGAQDLNDVSGAVALKNQMDQKSEYLDESELMNINPYAEDVTFIQYYVSADAVEANTFAEMYRSYIENGFLAKAIEENYDNADEVSYIAECVTVVKDGSQVYISSEDASENAIMNVIAESNTNCFTVKVCATTAEKCEELAQVVKAGLVEYQKVLEKNAGAHSLVLVEEHQTVIVDQALAELQNRNATAVKTIGTNLDKMKTEMSGDQIALYVYRTTDKADPEKTTEITTVQKPSISKKAIVLGFLLGIIVACFIIVATYLVTPKLRMAEEIKILYDAKVLGNVTNASFGKKKLFAPIDKFVKKLENHHMEADYEQEIDMICSNIYIACKNSNVNDVYLSGTRVEKMPKKLVDDIVEKCGEKSIQVICGKNIIYNALALEKAAEVSNVVILEEKRKSLYDEVYKEMVICQENKMNVIGVIVLGE